MNASQNPGIHPQLTDDLRAAVSARSEAALAQLREIARDFNPACFANSLGAEDMVLTDLIARHALPIEIFSLDTGRLPAETYDLMAAVEIRYDLKLQIYFPRHDAVEHYVRENGINAFYDSIALRKACCHIRKVEPLARALAGKAAWITGLRSGQSATRRQLPTHEYDEIHGLAKFNPLAEWSEKEIWAYLRLNEVPTNALHEKFYPSIGCAPCTRAISLGEDPRAGRWWWESEDSRECGLHVK